jgi:uroporphyrinogen-III decarboxylase
MDEYEWPELPDPTAAELAEVAEGVKKWHEEGFAVIMDGIISSVYEHAWMMRGFKKFHTDLYTNEKFVRELLDTLRKRYIKRTKFLAGLQPDIIEGGEDWGTQVGMVIRPEHWRRYFKPILSESIEAAKKACGAYISYHSDGKIEPIIPDLVKMGVDILNPIQPDCMDPAKIKRLYGDKLTLEGTISVQETLPFGTVEQVKDVVKERIETCGYDGGLILRPTHVVEPPTPIENVIALYETAQTYRPSWTR